MTQKRRKTIRQRCIGWTQLGPGGTKLFVSIPGARGMLAYAVFLTVTPAIASRALFWPASCAVKHCWRSSTSVAILCCYRYQSPQIQLDFVIRLRPHMSSEIPKRTVLHLGLGPPSSHVIHALASAKRNLHARQCLSVCSISPRNYPTLMSRGHCWNTVAKMWNEVIVGTHYCNNGNRDHYCNTTM